MNNSTTNYGKTSRNGCNGTKYVIKNGDTLYSISRRYNVPLALILRANPYVDVYNLQIGDEICVPDEQQQDSAQTLKPPVVTGPEPVVFPINNAVRQPASDFSNTQTRTAEGVRESMTAVPIQEPITTPVEEVAVDTTPISNIGQENQTMGMYFAKSEPQEPSVKMRSVIKPTMVAPVRIIAQPKTMMESDACSMDDKQKVRNWSSYQDRERFNTIMYNADQMKCQGCNREKRCTENIAVSDNRNQEKMAVIGYVSREEDSLQDILDYFTISMEELLQYNSLAEFKLKPGCMLQVPNSCNEL